MVKNLLVFTCFLALTTIKAQSLQNQVIGSLGGSITANAITLNQTVGEVIVANSTGSNATLQQGFQQGFILSGIYWNGSTSASWSNPLNWDGGILPTTTDNVIVTNVSTSPVLNNSSSIISNLELKTNASLSILKEGALIINNNFTNTGNVTINSDASQSGVLLIKGVPTGNITYNRGGLLMNKWSLLASPVKNQTIVAFAQNTANEIRVNRTVTPNRFAIGYYNDANAIGNKWAYFDANTNILDVFTTGVGYSISRANDGVVSYSGTLTTNNIEKVVTANKWNAIGNSYTSYYPINKNGGNSFLDDNSSRLSVPSVYVWENSQEKYISITNLVSSTERFIAPAQGFFVNTNAATNVLFYADKRSEKPETGVHLFNKSANKIPFIKLYATKGNVKVNTDIIYSTTATKGYDVNEDIENFGGASFDINSHLIESTNNKSYTIQSLPESEIESLIVPLNLKGQANDNIVFSIETTDFPETLKVYLEDKLTNSFVRLDEKNTEFTVILSENTSGIGRFYVHTTSNHLSIESNTLESIQLYKLDDETLRINGLQNENVVIKIFDILGKHLFRTNFRGEMQNNIKIPNFKTAVYLVEITTDKGKIMKKIFL